VAFLATTAFLAACGGSGRSHVGAAGSRDAAAAVPQAGVTVGTLRISPRDTSFVASTGRRVFAVVVPPSGRRAAVMRILRGRPTTSRRVAFALANDIAAVSAGPGGLYAGTAVSRRFKAVPDELVRIDPTTLAIVARASFPSRVASVEQGQAMWASIGDGRMVRLDPRTLAIRASRHVASAPVGRSTPMSAPAVGAGSLWVLAGALPNLELIRLDPTSLAVRSRTRIGGRGLDGLVHAVVARGSHVYLVGEAIVRVDATGKLESRRATVHGLATADVDGSTLVGLIGGPPALVRLDARGRVIARTALRDSGSQLAISGRDAWFVGDVGRGNGIVHMRLNAG
jgi:hypothetical protein